MNDDWAKMHLTLFTCLASGTPMKHSWAQLCLCRRHRTSVQIKAGALVGPEEEDGQMDLLPVVLEASERGITFPWREDG